MAGFVSIATIAPCPDKGIFRDIVLRYLQALISLGIAEPALLEWGNSLQWPGFDEGIDTEWPLLRIKAGDEAFDVKLMFIIWEDDERQGKITLELLFDMEAVLGPGAPFAPDQQYSSEVGRMAWRVMQAIFAAIPGHGCYLADEICFHQVLKAVNKENCDFWLVDLAIVPREIYECYLPAAGYTAVKRQDEIGIFANRHYMEAIPWE